jgi:hypothetical protein
MKTVDLTTDMRPWRAGDAVHVPSSVARDLVKNGEAKNLRPFDPTGGGPSPDAERPKGAYLTKGKRDA